MVNISNGVDRYPGLIMGAAKGSLDPMVTFPPIKGQLQKKSNSLGLCIRELGETTTVKIVRKWPPGNGVPNEVKLFC